MQTSNVVMTVVPKDQWKTFREYDVDIVAMFALNRYRKDHPEQLCGYITIFEYVNDQVGEDADNDDDLDDEATPIKSGCKTYEYYIYGYAVKNLSDPYGGRSHPKVQDAAEAIVEKYNQDLAFLCCEVAEHYQFMLDIESVTQALSQVPNV